MLKNPLPDLNTYEFEELAFKQLMQKRINNILIVCSSYDYYLLEEDGRIDEQIFEEYMALNLRYPPNFSHASSAEQALKILQEHHIDLVITWVNASARSLEIGSRVKREFPYLPVAALSHSSEELRKMLRINKSNDIDFVFHWSGNIDIFLAIIKLVEDQKNAENDINAIGVKSILLVEDSLRFYSQYLPLIYKIVLKQSETFSRDSLNAHRKMMTKRGRPKILLATNYEEGIYIFNKYKDHLLGIISDVTYYKDGVNNKQAGFLFAQYTRQERPDIPILIQSSNIKNKEKAKKSKLKFLHKHSETIGLDISKFISKYLSFGSFDFYCPDKKRIVRRAKDLNELQKAISEVSIDSLVHHAKRNDFSKWLQARALFPLASLFSKIEYEDFTEEDHVRSFLIASVSAFRIYRSRGVITKFDKLHYDKSMIFSRIGDGALGGKGRGLAFIDMFLKKHKLSNKYDDINISIPRTVVLSTDVFDEFMERHNLFSFVAQDHTDEEILMKFISKSLPHWAVENIKALLHTVETPLAIRSSSVLEDSIYQPFAGIFSTYMVPQAEPKKFLEMVTNAIKSVMASAFYKSSKSYIKATSHAIEESKMAVILQEVIGKEYEKLYYPNVSGVARSINVYPLGNEKPEEGIANIALGLGEIIVGGGRTLRFSPYHPKNILQLSNPGTAQRETQKYFFGLDTNPESYHVSTSEAVNKIKVPLRKAKKHNSLRFVASTYDLQNNLIKPGVMHDGIRVLTFDNILKYNTFPLAEILKELLHVGQTEMQNPIEIEFAVKLDVAPDEPKVFSFLQIRPIVELDSLAEILHDQIDEKDTIIFSNSALGNGFYKGIRDVVYVKPQSFDKSKTKEIALKVAEVNEKFEKENKKYVLIGPGRWGSSDPWLGIPVIWPQISNAKVIIESGLDNFRIDPSQGTHFFQNLTSFKVGYLTLNPFIKDGFYDVGYLNNLPAVFENEFIRHVQFFEPLTIVIEGRNNKAAIFKEGYTLNNGNGMHLS
jgi:hypothetical protein